MRPSDFYVTARSRKEKKTDDICDIRLLSKHKSHGKLLGGATSNKKGLGKNLMKITPWKICLRKKRNELSGKEAEIINLDDLEIILSPMKRASKKISIEPNNITSTITKEVIRWQLFPTAQKNECCRASTSAIYCKEDGQKS